MKSLFIALITLVAIVIAILGISLPVENLKVIHVITNFFSIMIPILAVGALIVYLWNNCHCSKKQHQG